MRTITLQAAKRQYPHRFTMEHVPDWANKRPCDDGGTVTRYYAPQYCTDLEWYENTVFPGEGGIPKREKYCESRGETWPLGKWLAAPYRKGE